MSEEKPSWQDWLLYFGSKDERHRRAADRAGHLAFYLALAAAALDFVFRASALKADLLEGLASMRTDLAVILFAGGYYTLQWVRSGITLRDSPRQRRVLFWLCPAAGLVTGSILFWQWHQELGWDVAALTGLGGGFVAWGLCWATYLGMDKAASRLDGKNPGDPL